jgi:hypothetical protein
MKGAEMDEQKRKWALMDAVMLYGQASRRLGMVSGSRDSEEVAQAARAADKAFEAVLNMVYPPRENRPEVQS